MLHYGPRIGAIGLGAVAFVLAVIGAVLSRQGLEVGGGLLIVLAVVSLLIRRLQRGRTPRPVEDPVGNSF